MSLGAEHLLLDPSDGSIEARYAIRPGEYAAATDDGKLLIRRELAVLSDGEGDRYELALYDPAANRTLWTVQETPAPPPAPAPQAATAGSALFAHVGGKPTALDKRDGRVLWQANVPGVPPADRPPALIRPTPDGNVLLLPAAGDWLAVRVSDGALLYRLRDAAIGFPDGRDGAGGYGALHADDEGRIYLGSANGYFSVLRLSSPPHGKEGRDE